jgi:hypothetical protein
LELLDGYRARRSLHSVAGAGSGQDGPGAVFPAGFCRVCRRAHNPLVASYYENDELFLFPDAIAKSRVYYQLKAFYQQDFQRELYGQVARLPLKLFINASPDRFLANTLGEGKHHFAYFHKTDPQDNVPKPDLEKPLVYNLLGALEEEEESLLMTHDDLYEFLEAMLARQRLPRKLTDEIFAARSLIFLGFRFDKWYVQLLLRLLKVHDVRSRFARYATEQRFNADTLSICEEQFKIEFIGQDIDGFLAELYQRCEAENLLRELGTPTQTPQEQIRQFIEADELGPHRADERIVRWPGCRLVQRSDRHLGPAQPPAKAPAPQRDRRGQSRRRKVQDPGKLVGVD